MSVTADKVPGLATSKSSNPNIEYYGHDGVGIIPPPVNPILNAFPASHVTAHLPTATAEISRHKTQENGVANKK